VLKANEKSISMSKGSRCLRCDRPCNANVEFCNECREILRASFRQEPLISALRGTNDVPSSSSGASVSAALKVAEDEEEHVEHRVQDEQADEALPAEQKLRAQSSVKSPITPHPPVLESLPDSVAQAMTRLNEAALRIAEVEPGRNKRLPRASRLSPFRDISSEIRRESTPLPKFKTPRNQHDLKDSEELDTLVTGQNEQEGHKHIPSSDQGAIAPETAWPDLWPWFDTDDEGRDGEDTWAGRTDPLITRHKPNSAEAARIEEEDIRRAISEGVPTNLLPIRFPRKPGRLRMAFFALAIFAILALAIDGILLSVVFEHPHAQPGVPNGPSAPSLKLATNYVNISDQPQSVQLQILNFPRRTSVQLTHDIQESVQTSGKSSLVPIGTSGSANVTIEVTPDWGPGFHVVVAEDIQTRYTASATLQVFTAQTTKPAFLAIDAKQLDFGAQYEGVNTTRSLQLSNDGSGSITWSASSHQSWLVLSPNQGMFNRSQTIQVAVQRDLPPKDYTGTITFYSNVGPPEHISVTMGVSKLPSNPGPVLSLSPAALSFSTVDGSTQPLSQTLTISNPGSKPLDWALTATSSTTSSTMVAIAHALGASGNWLLADSQSGTVQAQSSEQINILISSSALLPGTYTGTLDFSAPGAIGSLQTVSVSLTVQPHCGLVTTTGFLPFTVVQGTANSGSQSLGLNATESCGGTVNWVSQVSSSGWLTVSPGSGQLKGITSQFLSVSVNATGLAPATYYGYIVFTAQNSTQTVFVGLQVQAAPSPTATAPIMAASPLNLNFSYTQGQPNPKGQVVTITNNGTGPLKWKTNPQQFGNIWLSASPSGGSVSPDQSGTVTINVDTSKLSPGTYAGQVTLYGTDINGKQASGSGQVVSINLVVQPPCTLTQPSSSSLAFTGVQGGTNPISQTVLITGTGNCTWPLVLSVPTPSANWLSVIANSSNINGNGQSASFTIGPGASYDTLKANTYSSQVTIAATDSAGTLAQGSPQTISVTLTVLPPCTLSAPAPASLSFTIDQGATSTTAQKVALHTSGTCALPVTYTASGNSWLTLSQPAADSGSGSSLSVNVNATSLLAGTITGAIAITANDSNGNSLTSTIPVTVTVVTSTISGIVYACTGVAPACGTTPTPLPGASITVINVLNATVATVTADATGAYIIPSLPDGAYTLTITGTDSGGTHYSGTGLALTVTGTATGVNFDVFPG
jgi:hypothetical protein